MAGCQAPEEDVAMDELNGSTERFGVKTAVKLEPSTSYVVATIVSSIVIIVLQFAHVFGLLYAEYVLIVNSGLDYSPLIYLQAVPTYIMAVSVLFPFVFYNKWKSWVLEGQPVEDAHVKPGITVLVFVQSVGLNIVIYTVQVLVVLIQVYHRHIARLPIGDRCNCYQGDLSYLISNTSMENGYKCICYIPSLPYYMRKFRIITDDLNKLTPDSVERYMGTEAEKQFTSITINKYQSEDDYEAAYAKERFSEPYTLVIILLICNLIILAVRMPLWIKVKELWVESEKHFMAKKIKASCGCLQEGIFSWKACIISASEVSRKLEALDKTYQEKKTSIISLIKDEFSFAFLEGADAIGLFLDVMQYAYVNPDNPTLVVAIVLICIDVCLFNWDNVILVIPIYGERVASYVRVTSTMFINLPFFAIRLIFLLDEGLKGFPFLLLVLFLMKEVTAFILSVIDLAQKLREDLKKRQLVKAKA